MKWMKVMKDEMNEWKDEKNERKQKNKQMKWNEQITCMNEWDVINEIP